MLIGSCILKMRICLHIWQSKRRLPYIGFKYPQIIKNLLVAEFTFNTHINVSVVSNIVFYFLSFPFFFIQHDKTSVTRQCMMGTLNYMPPEALTSDHSHINGASKVFIL